MPSLQGEGGDVSYGEWDDCSCCDGTGECIQEELNAYNAKIAEIDAEIDAIVAAETHSR